MCCSLPGSGQSILQHQSRNKTVDVGGKFRTDNNNVNITMVYSGDMRTIIMSNSVLSDRMSSIIGKIAWKILSAKSRSNHYRRIGANPFFKQSSGEVNYNGNGWIVFEIEKSGGPQTDGFHLSFKS